MLWNVTYSNIYLDDSSGSGLVLDDRNRAVPFLVLVVIAYFAVIGGTMALKPYLQWINHLRTPHNLALCIFSGIVFVLTLRMFLQEKHFDSLQAMNCQQIADPSYQIVGFLFLVSKIWEWFDTVLLVVAGKPLRWVHVLHHATTFWMYAVNHAFTSSSKWGVMVNAFVHLVMYAHYTRPFPKIFRPWITRLQLIQFGTALWFHLAIWWRECDERVHTHVWEFATPFLLVLLYAVLFVNFYIQQYVFSRGDKRAKSE
eukprot:gnl/TRDRNA2_/TRDRNA2_201874_c0_seq1.p1 gnl/TRDRNA2_/TRDRNA2_201874_c0~~gnl/TRDRNA2_/TRDRNA2_201874_c0_seq1.p1  ORF type:complete len:272 (-),score=29.70 gnl/TRDRNA2_/TRDRNA2_201874_c0_seq1:75-842(-)